MKKVFVNFSFDDKQKKRLESISDQYEFVYEVDKSANIIIGNYHTKELINFTNLEWIQTAAVGVDKYIKKGILAEDVVLTNAVDVHSTEVAEHMFASIVSTVKKLHLYRDDQHKHTWKDEGMVKELSKLKVAIIGFGNIGKVLAKLLKGIGAYVIGVKRTIGEKPEYVDELYTNKDLIKAINDVDVVACVLPGVKANENLFTVDTFKAMRKDAIFINAGRGNLCSEETILEVLENNIIDTFISDVFIKEPLDPKSKLWDYQNMIITPHAAGSYHLQSAKDAFLDLVVDNLERYIKGEKLLHIVEERE